MPGHTAPPSRHTCAQISISTDGPCARRSIRSRTASQHSRMDWQRSHCALQCPQPPSVRRSTLSKTQAELRTCQCAVPMAGTLGGTYLIMAGTLSHRCHPRPVRCSRVPPVHVYVRTYVHSHSALSDSCRSRLRPTTTLVTRKAINHAASSTHNHPARAKAPARCCQSHSHWPAPSLFCGLSGPRLATSPTFVQPDWSLVHIHIHTVRRFKFPGTRPSARPLRCAAPTAHRRLSRHGGLEGRFQVRLVTVGHASPPGRAHSDAISLGSSLDRDGASSFAASSPARELRVGGWLRTQCSELRTQNPRNVVDALCGASSH
ncbi:hypothetical protein C8Q80DRAFT_608354 [Daedaleopsis nitida]|nr:hypothetical protein C8Q80DRAFT_608354 [Daedaleopsis nitida]